MGNNSNLFLNDSKNNSKKIISKSIKLGLDFIKSKNIKKPVIDFLEQDQIWNRLNEDIPLKSKDLNLILKEFERKIMKNSINFGNPNYLGFPDCGISTAAQIGHILSGLINQNMINSISASPTATFVDILLIKWMRNLLGLKTHKRLKSIYDVGGIATIGGVSSNVLGILLAREVAIKKYSKNLLRKFKIFVSKEINHYSIERAIFWLGLDKNSLVFINIDKDFKLDIKDLKKKILKEKTKGGIPIAIISYAGNSKTMSIDNFKEIYNVAKENNIWFHIDACHGFSLAFSNKLNKKIEGINLADSITLDPHKTLFIPYNLSFFIVKDPQNMKFIAHKGNIVLEEPFSFGAINPFVGSLAFNSLKLWFLIKNLGKIKIGKLIEERYNLILWFADHIKKDKNFVCLGKPHINSCLFYFLPEKDRINITKDKIGRYNKINQSLFQSLFQEGEYYIHSFNICDYGNKIDKKKKYNLRCFRVTIGNPLTTKENLTKLLKKMGKIGDELSQKRNN